MKSLYLGVQEQLENIGTNQMSLRAALSLQECFQYKDLSHDMETNPFKDPTLYVYKLDGVGPVDNRPSTDQFHKKNKKNKNKKCDM